VVNPGSAPVTVRVTGQAVEFGDEGRVIVAGNDPLWAGRVEFPANPVTVPAQSHQDVGLVVHMPGTISPDLYFVGFLVTPEPDTAANLTYINQIGSYVTIDVPGPRTRVLQADFDVPGFAFADDVQAGVHVHNVGGAAAVFWGENDTTATPGSSSPSQQRLDRSLLPAGRSRTVVVAAKPSFPISFVTVKVHIIYSGTSEAATTEIVVSKRVLVVQPIVVFIAGGLLMVAGGWYIHRQRQRRVSRQHAVRRGPRGGANVTSSSDRPRVPVARAVDLA
jgi:hypothetical protein